VAKGAAFLAVITTLLVGSALPASASTGASVADAQPWHYWIAFVILASALGITLIALPVGYYKRVYRLKHPKR
jgi:thiosulfate reductase cytochrome b subunit